MLSTNDVMNIFLPTLGHWVIWLSFFVATVFIALLYAYPYIFRRPKSEYLHKHLSIPIICIVSLYVFTKMLEEVIYHGPILKIDAWFNGFTYSSLITQIAFFITNFGGTVMITVLFAITIGVLILKKRWRYALISTAALLGALVLQLVIKSLTQRVRPENLIETNFSFPSGHTIMAIVFVSLLIYSFKDDFKNKVIKYVLISAFSLFFVSIGISRIIIHVHWFSDVVAGLSLGLAWFMLLVLIERSITGLVPAVKRETQKAKAIVPEGAAETVKTVVEAVPKEVVKTTKAIAQEDGKK
jgi:membrane-associated phospholipid phosphatase